VALRRVDQALVRGFQYVNLHIAEAKSRGLPLQEPPPPDFIARIRGELADTLARVREAVALPWKDLTAATLAELRFNSIAGWLPDDEASALRAAFQCEINRLYAIAEEGDQA
jgi:hypothetical protein